MCLTWFCCGERQVWGRGVGGEGTDWVCRSWFFRDLSDGGVARALLPAVVARAPGLL
ncbi:Uncharacterised protein [Dermatophilus congolensis]|uniref:Uncharacterized protein n=1 Tax=Dermatophilus congolensis TaxID=1863 RepID=A0A239VD31_9MICO|nr:Uncharacterised protein [Dermatophilus congolensis]